MAYDKHSHFTYYNIEDDIEELLKLQGFNGQLNWWRSLCNGRLIPNRDDIQFRDLMGWHADIILSELTDGIQGYKIKIIGENVKKILGTSLQSGSYFSEVSNMKEKTRIRHQQLLSSGKIIAYFEDYLPIAHRDHVKIKSLALPFLDKDNKCSYLISFFNRDT